MASAEGSGRIGVGGVGGTRIIVSQFVKVENNCIESRVIFIFSFFYFFK